jgi:2-keto-4-pentenoate hydratase/2-oxohepta-3-ene-1,7-dioic acid hydratase in catechol pathway
MATILCLESTSNDCRSEMLMRFCSVKNDNRSEGAIIHNNRVIAFSELNRETGIGLPPQLLDVVQISDKALLRQAASRLSSDLTIGKDVTNVLFSAPFSSPPKILGIGLNYREHAADLGTQTPTEPASFMKPRTTIIGPDDPIILPSPSTSKRVTAEAELAIVIGKRCKNIREEDAESVVFGYASVLDMTAEDILQRNPRFLTRAKSFDTFLSFGPVILTPDEISNLPDLTVRTILNGTVIRSNQVRNMTFSPNQLIAFHSRVMTFESGDIICTGTPGATAIRPGDVVQCQIDGFPALSNPVIQGD